MERAAADARYAALHEDAPYHDGSFSSWAEQRSPSHPYHYSEGVTVGVAERDLAPWDKFTTEVSASPVKPLSALDEWRPGEGDAAEN